MKKYTRGLVFISALLMVFPMLETAIPALGAPSTLTGPVTIDSASTKIAGLKGALEKTPNFLQYTEYKMLQRKYPAMQKPQSDTHSNYGDYGLKPYGTSPLSQEFSGGFFQTNTNELGEGIDILTGEQAVDESMQIGSIGFDRENGFVIASQRQLTSALELYYNDKNKYPQTLNELTPLYIGVIPTGFSYQNLGKTYKLTVESSVPAKQINISEVSPLEIKSHPWESMVKTTPKIPEMFSLVPADDAFIYFRDLQKLTELEKTITAIGKPLDSIYNLSNSIEVKNKIFKRLGIKDIPELRKFIDEAGLVSYDMDAYPNTDYALILKVKSSLLNNFISDFISAPQDRQAQVGNYFVIATDKSFLESIQKASTGNSLAKEKDLSYALSVLENNFDGFTYLSEKFIQKLTSPSYRINARRRNTVLKALETFQYTVFAYKDITGAWPKTLQQIVDENYIDGSNVANLSNYTIDEKGIVKHKDWGSIYNVTPIFQVPISLITESENTLYKSFKEGYEQYWREFIDPVGVSITVGDQIRFHTIILPLIDKSEYNFIKDIAGNDGITFDFLKNPDRLPSFQLVTKLNVDDSIYAYYKSMGKYGDEDYQKCQEDYYKNRNWKDTQAKTLDEVCKFNELNKPEAVNKIKNQVAKALDWQEKTQVFDFIDNEFTLVGGENLVFNLEDLSNFDLYLGMEMKDQEMAKKFIEKLFAWYGKQYSNGESRKVGYGIFSLEAFKPIKNTYNNVDYFMVPLGFTNIYYLFQNNRLYVAVSQATINKLIDGGSKKNTKDAVVWPTHMQRMFDYLGDKMNVALAVDNTKLQSWLKGAIKNQWTSYSGATSIKNINNYYTESLALANALNNANVDEYYRFAPKQWFDATIGIENEKVFLESNGQKFFLEDIDLGYSAYNFGMDQDYKTKTKLEDITKNFNIDKTLEDWQKLKDLGLALNLTKEGLDIRIAFNNVASEKFDKRVPKSGLYAKKINWVLYGGSGAGVIILGVAVWFLLRRRKNKLNSEALPIVPTPTNSTETPILESNEKIEPPQNLI